MDSTAAVSSRASRGTAPVIAGRLALVVGTVVSWIQHQQQIRQTRRRLMVLDDHILADIGLSRDQVKYVARNGHTLG